ncbi:MAG: CoA pyrophosphatase [Pseudomonadales bacterium]|nr:CoA pyrophosphatase [Pseudomonadales bacterium]
MTNQWTEAPSALTVAQHGKGLHACTDQLRQAITANLQTFHVQTATAQTEKELRRAAVALTVTDVGPGADLAGIPQPDQWSAESALILTRRSNKLRNHPGQWALPGGRLDADETPVEAALREMHEEVGIDLGQANVIGMLDDFVTRSGYIMTPVVIWGGPLLQTNHSPYEVASVHRIPLAQFARQDAPMLSDVSTSDAPVLRMPVGDDHIAAPTAAILYQFREVCLLARHTRVAHFEQPEFAWR